MKVAVQIVTAIEQQFSDLKIAINAANHKPISTAYLIWNNPFMAAGGDTFIHQMLTAAGCHNVFANIPRYPTTTLKQLVEMQTELVLLSTEPFPFRESHKKQLQQAMPKAKILLVDGEYFSWYGSRLLQSPAYFLSLQQQIHG
jgi:ABC-type Fe3+-hydroxamate transport system substrate-binding protein